MNDAIFRKYDLRGKVGTELIIDDVYDLTKAILFYCAQQEPLLTTVAVGMDGRVHSPAIKDEVCRAIQDSGLHVLFIGTCPSPVLYFAMHTQPIEAGIMITASHNPGHDNGLKLCLGKGSLWGDDIVAIKELYHQRKSLPATTRGSYSEKPMIEFYVAWIEKNFAHLQDMDTAVAVDCGNGVAGTVMPLLIERMRWPNVKLLFAEVDGTYPNHEADPIVEKNMLSLRHELAVGRYDFGIGFDGDVDRMAPMTKEGFLVPGDQVLGIYAQSVAQERPGVAVVFDVNCSGGLTEMVEQAGGRACPAATGCCNIKNEMKKQKSLLAGEISCHFIFADRYFGYDDGMYAMLRLFEIVRNSGKTLTELVSAFPKKFSSPTFRIKSDDEAKWNIIAAVHDHFKQRHDVSLVTVDGVRATMPYGWGIVRASNTQPAITLRCESSSAEGLARVKADFVALLTPYLGAETLKHICES
jgi:phosphomannomutase / phosphoglucomutase